MPDQESRKSLRYSQDDIFRGDILSGLNDHENQGRSVHRERGALAFLSVLVRLFTEKLMRLFFLGGTPFHSRDYLGARMQDSDPFEDPTSAEQLLLLVYEELRKLAAFKMASERPGQTLQPTALVHEAWLKISKSNQINWQNRTHFFAVAAEAMRRILIDRARKRQVRERAGLAHKVEFDETRIEVSAPLDEILAIDGALESLERESPEAAVLVKLRYFSGMTMPECADAMDKPLRTVERTWTFARSWLRTELKIKPE